MRRPFENRELVATKNGLKFVAADSQYIDIPAIDMNFGSGEFFISIMANVATDVYQTILQMVNDSYYGFYIGQGYGSPAKTFQIISAFGVHYEVALTDFDTFEGKQLRFTIMRRGDNIETWINNRILSSEPMQFVGGGETFNLGSITRFNIGGEDEGTAGMFSGLVSNFVVAKCNLTQAEMDHFHNTNVMPGSTHEFIIAHYPLNQDHGNVAFDVVEQYNYAKTTSLDANHGDLVNFTNTQVGIVNPLLQSAWRNVYNDQQGFLRTFRCIDDAVYGSVDLNLGNLTQWTVIFNITIEHGFVPGFKNVFCNKNTLDADSLLLFYQDSAVVIDGKIGDFSIYVGTDVGQSGTFGIYDKKPLTCVMTFDGTTFNTYTSPGDGIIYEITRVLPLFVLNADLLQFFRYTGNPNYGQGVSMNKFQLLDRVISTGERSFVLQNRTAPFGRRLEPGNKLDVNFGEIFLDGSDYKVRDYSGNNMHVLLNNFVPVDSQPLLIEQSTGLPPIKNALKFNGTNQCLSISGFNATAEKGYTFIVGFKADADLAPDYNRILSKGGSAKAIMRYQGVSEIRYHTSTTSQSTNVKTPTRLNFIGFSEGPRPPYAYEITSYQNGMLNDSFLFDSDDPGLPDLVGFDELSGDLVIAADSGLFSFYSGYLFFVAIWKGILKQHEVINLMNNTFGQNLSPELMTDCQLYLNFDEIIDDSGTYKITDHSPQKHSVVMHNYSADEIDPGHVDYRLASLDQLRS